MTIDSQSHQSTSALRSFSTTAGTGTLLMKPIRMPSLKWVFPLTAAVSAGVMISKYRESTEESRRLAAAQAAEDAERQRQHEKLMDVYGDRSSLEALEKATEFYSSSTKSSSR